MPYSIRRVDSIHQELIAAARGVGADVIDTHDLGHGAPDFIAILFNRPFLIEAKSEHGRRTADEVEFAAGLKTTVHVVRSVDELLTLFGIQIQGARGT